MNKKTDPQRQPGRADHGQFTRTSRATLVLAALLVATTAGATAPAGRYLCDGLPCSTAMTTTVVDSKTNLQWQRAVVATSYNWTAALAYCEGLTLAGFSDWRLPNVKELSSLIDVFQYTPAIDPVVFPATPMAWFWSSSPHLLYAGSGWGVSFDTGLTNQLFFYVAARVRCVR